MIAVGRLLAALLFLIDAAINLAHGIRDDNITYLLLAVLFAVISALIAHDPERES